VPRAEEEAEASTPLHWRRRPHRRSICSSRHRWGGGGSFNPAAAEEGYRALTLGPAEEAVGVVCSASRDELAVRQRSGGHPPSRCLCAMIYGGAARSEVVPSAEDLGRRLGGAACLGGVGERNCGREAGKEKER
jgi:hypothetical protein